jgi:DNA-binding NtrC family response regulator
MRKSEIIVIIDDAKMLVEDTLFLQEEGILQHTIIAAAFYTLDEITKALESDTFVGIDGTIYTWAAITMALVDQNLHSANDKSGEKVVAALKAANPNIITIGISHDENQPQAADVYLGKNATLAQPFNLEETLYAVRQQF